MSEENFANSLAVEVNFANSLAVEENFANSLAVDENFANEAMYFKKVIDVLLFPPKKKKKKKKKNKNNFYSIVYEALYLFKNILFSCNKSINLWQNTFL